MALTSTVSWLSGWVRSVQAPIAVSPFVRGQAAVLFSMIIAVQRHGARGDVYNILWAVVFGFATLNILGLAARRLEPARRGMSFGEMMAVTVVLLSIFMLGWELLGLFHIFPIKLKR